MNNQNIKELDRAHKLVEAYKSPRTRTLEFWESVADGTRYAGLPGWFEDTDAPIWDRAPCIKYQAVESAVASNIDLLLGENRYPVVTSRPDESEDDEQEDGTDHEQSETLDRFLISVKDEADLEPLFRELYDTAQKTGTCVALVGARNGELFAETTPAKYATPKRDAKRQLSEIEICYPYIDTERRSDGWYAVAKLYRRVITATSDTTFLPGLCRDDGAVPVWQVDPAQTVQHGLGFVPAVWYKHRAPKSSVAGEDGKPVHATICDELLAVDIALSMRHEGALNCRPQTWETGVEPGYNPTAPARSTAVAHGTRNGGVVHPVNNPATSSYHTRPSSGAEGKRRRGPGFVWQYESPDTKVGAIDPPGDALKALDDHIRDLRTKLCEVLAWVPLDPDSVKFAATVSGKALEVLRERQLNRISNDRQTFGKQCMLQVYQLLLRIVHKLKSGLLTPGIDKVIPVIAAMTDKSGEWQPPRLSFVWPPYFLPSAEDTEKTVNTTEKAHTAGFITLRTAVEKLARSYNIQNVDLYLDQLEGEREEREAKQVEQMADSISKMHAGLNDPNAGRRGANPAANAGGGSAGAAAAASKASPGSPGQARPGKG